MKLVDRLSGEELLARLRAVSPPGIEFLEAQVLTDGDPPLGRMIAEAHYAVRLPDGCSARAAEARWASGEPLLATRRERSDSRRPDRGNEVDVRKRMVCARVADEAERRRLARELGWDAGEDRLLCFALAVSAQGSARPVEVAEALFGEGAAAGCGFVRTRFGAA